LQKPRGFYLWLALVSMLLPFVEFIAFSIIYDTFIELAVEISMCYIPIGVISGAFALYLMMSTRYKTGKKYIFCGYIISIALTLTISVMLKESSHLLVANILGAAVLLGGTFLAYITKPRKRAFYI